MAEAFSNSESSFTNQTIRLCLLLGLLLLLAFPLIAYFGYSKHGSDGIVAAVVAAAVCFAAGCLALVVTGLFQSIGQGMNGLLLSMAIRTGVPLVAGLSLSMQDGPLAQAGVFGMIVFNYLIMLTIETICAVKIIQTNDATPAVNRDATPVSKG